MRSKGRVILLGWTGVAAVVAIALSALQNRSDRAAGATKQYPPPTSQPRPAPLQPPGGRFDFVIIPGHGIDSVRPRPGQWVRVPAGQYKPFSFPVAGTPGKPIYYSFEAGAIVDGTGANVVVQGVEHIYIQGMTVRNARNGLQGENAAVKIGSGVTLADCVLEDIAGAGLAIYGQDITVLRTSFQRCGHEAFTTQAAKNVLIKDCRILHCNNGLEDPPWKASENAVQIKGKWFVNPDWEAVSKIWNSDNITLDGVESAHNVGPGLWTDYKNTNITIRNCWSHDNRGLTDNQTWQGEGLRAELSPDAGGIRVANCLFERNSGAGVTLTSVRDVQVEGNTFVGGIGVLFRNDDDRGGLHDIKVTGNTFDHAQVAMWGSRTPLTNVIVDGNVFTTGTRPLFNWDRVDFDSLAEVRRALKFEQNGRMQ